MLLYQPLGDGSEKFIYITHQIKETTKTGTENVTNTVQKDAQKATLVKNDEMVLSRVLGQNTIWPC